MINMQPNALDNRLYNRAIDKGVKLCYNCGTRGKDMKNKDMIMLYLPLLLICIQKRIEAKKGDNHEIHS